MGQRWMLQSRSPLSATDPVLQLKIRDFADVLRLPERELPPATLAKFAHRFRRFPALFWPLRAGLHRNRAGLYLTFDIHTLDAQAPFLLSSGGRSALVLMDAWPKVFETVARWVTQYQITDVFISSSQAKGVLTGLAPQVNWHWLPEGLPTDAYVCRDWSERTMEVLSFGRKHNDLHATFRAELPQVGIDYRFEPKPLDLLFPTHEELLDGLGSAKISVCFPSSVTHPERSGSIETVTLRYFQSMASGCVLLGQSPAELRELFGYDPVVPVDWSDPVGQVQAILSDPDEYLALAARNRETVLSAHTERHRAAELARVLGWPCT